MELLDSNSTGVPAENLNYFAGKGMVELASTALQAASEVSIKYWENLPALWDISSLGFLASSCTAILGVPRTASRTKRLYAEDVPSRR